MDVWDMTAAERASLVEALAALPEASWDQPSWCAGWNVRDVVGHIIAAATETTAAFFAHLAGAGFNFDRFTDKRTHGITAGKSTKELVDTLRARISTRNSPPGPKQTWLGEVVIHGEDIFRPLGIPREHAMEHVLVVADFYKGSNLVVGAKKRIAGLTLRATDAQWTTGSGPEVTGPSMSLLMAMVGRGQVLADLGGAGVDQLRARC